MTLREQLPNIYTNFLNPKILSENPQEPLATCDNCLMSRPERGKLPYYSRDLKCCTYHPFMPNYLIGSILSDSQIPDFIRGKIKEKIKKREFVLPLGIVAPIPLQIEFHNRKLGEFGCREEWICPYFDKENKNCGIWRHRGSVCTTFYCKSVKKKKGESYWFSLSEYLSFTEMFLAEECLNEFDYTPKEVSDQMEFLNRTELAEVQAEVQDKEYLSYSLTQELTNKLWKNSSENIEEFYKDCFDFVKKINRKKFLNQIGEFGKELEKSCLKNYKDACYE